MDPKWRCISYWKRGYSVLLVLLGSIEVMSWWKTHPQIFLSSKKQKFTGAPISELPIKFASSSNPSKMGNSMIPPGKKNTWVFPKTGVFPPKWMVKIMENPIKMGWFGGKTPYFRKHPPFFVSKSKFHPQIHQNSPPEPATLRWLEVELVIRPHSEWRPSHENQRQSPLIGKKNRPPKTQA